MASREAVTRVLHAIRASSCKCPAHSVVGPGRVRHNAATSSGTEYAFESASSTLRFGDGVTKEAGQDLANLGAKKVGVFTDPNVVKIPSFQLLLDSLTTNKITYELYSDVICEPTSDSVNKAGEFAKKHGFDAYVAIGGGSVMDTTKLANLLATNPQNDLLDFVAAPVGKGVNPVRPNTYTIAIPTTSGTSSENTSVAVFDHTALKAKFGIANRSIRPTLGLIDALHTESLPDRVAAYSGFDVLCHSLESFTALPYNERTPCPSNPRERPIYQGSNPASDIWSLEALRLCMKFLKRSAYDAGDFEARKGMHFAGSIAAAGFGNAGVHLCHGLSYPISGMVGEVGKFSVPGYHVTKSLIPHGLSVVITAPSVFEFCAPLCPERHLQGAEILGADISNAKKADAGKILGDTLRKFCYEMEIHDGISALGYSKKDIPAFVEGALPQKRVLALSPKAVGAEEIAGIYENAMKMY